MIELLLLGCLYVLFKMIASFGAEESEIREASEVQRLREHLDRKR